MVRSPGGVVASLKNREQTHNLGVRIDEQVNYVIKEI
jgi:hypothetical protein